MRRPIRLQAADFDREVLVREEPMVVLFHAEWCPFSRAFRRLYQETCRRYPLKFAEVDISDEDNPLWERYSIETVPTLIVFKRGEEVARRAAERGVGLSETELEEVCTEVEKLN